MPELPEVQTVVDHLSRMVQSRHISGVNYVRTDMISPDGCDIMTHLCGRKIVTIVRRAKRIVFQLDNQERFYIHLGMTGRLTCDTPKSPIKPHTHLILDLDDARQLRFVDPRRFGAIVWMGQSPDAYLGPEPLTLKPDRLHRILTRTTRAIKTALLDQRLIAGIGNIYADEALFGARISPTTRGCDLSIVQTHALNRAIKTVLRRAIRAGGSSIRDYVDPQGRPGTFQSSHQVYDREDQPCFRCKTAIVRVVLGGRSTHYCPTCQDGSASVSAT